MRISCVMPVSRILISLCVIRQKIRIKISIADIVLRCFSREKVLMEHKEVCLKLNGKQNAKLRSGSIKFQNYFKQLAVPFKIYIDFDSFFKMGSERWR